MQTGMYAISEMASLFNVSRQTLIYYDKIGLFKPAVVNEKGYRFYSPTQIPLMRLICMLRDLGLELDEIDRLTSTFDIGEMTDHLRSRVQALDEQIAGLKAERASVQERLSFYDEAVYWREREGKPELKQFERRYVVFEEFPGDIERGRSMLHPTLMRAILRMRALTGTRPMRGWGAMLRREALHSDDPIAGAGSFAVLPRGAEELLPSDAAELAKIGVEVLPEGTYLCMSRWGMPYEPEGIRAIVACMDKHALQPVGNAFDFCYLDTTSYDESHQEDFCCIQIPVALQMRQGDDPFITFHASSSAVWGYKVSKCLFARPKGRPVWISITLNGGIARARLRTRSGTSPRRVTCRATRTRPATMPLSSLMPPPTPSSP